MVGLVVGLVQVIQKDPSGCCAGWHSPDHISSRRKCLTCTGRASRQSSDAAIHEKDTEFEELGAGL